MALRPVLGRDDLAALVRAHRALVVVGWRSDRPRGLALRDAMARLTGPRRGFTVVALDAAVLPALAEGLGLGAEPQLLFYRGGHLVMRELVPRLPERELARRLAAAEPAWRGYFGRAPCWPVPS